MAPARHDGWHEHEAARRAATRRVLGEGAVVGFAVGLVCQLFVGESFSGGEEWLVRAALLLPAVVFLVWWLVSPGLRNDALVDPSSSQVPAREAARTRRIEQVFDSAAVPRPHRERPAPAPDGPDHGAFRASLRRSDSDGADPGSFGVPRPQVPARDADVR